MMRLIHVLLFGLVWIIPFSSICQMQQINLEGKFLSLEQIDRGKEVSFSIQNIQGSASCNAKIVISEKNGVITATQLDLSSCSESFSDFAKNYSLASIEKTESAVFYAENTALYARFILIGESFRLFQVVPKNPESTTRWQINYSDKLIVPNLTTAILPSQNVTINQEKPSNAATKKSTPSKTAKENKADNFPQPIKLSELSKDQLAEYSISLNKKDAPSSNETINSNSAKELTKTIETQKAEIKPPKTEQIQQKTKPEIQQSKKEINSTDSLQFIIKQLSLENENLLKSEQQLSKLVADLEKDLAEKQTKPTISSSNQQVKTTDSLNFIIEQLKLKNENLIKSEQQLSKIAVDSEKQPNSETPSIHQSTKMIDSLQFIIDKLNLQNKNLAKSEQQLSKLVASSEKNVQAEQAGYTAQDKTKSVTFDSLSYVIKQMTLKNENLTKSEQQLSSLVIVLRNELREKNVSTQKDSLSNAIPEIERLTKTNIEQADLLTLKNIELAEAIKKQSIQKQTIDSLKNKTTLPPSASKKQNYKPSFDSLKLKYEELSKENYKLNEHLDEFYKIEGYDFKEEKTKLAKSITDQKAIDSLSKELSQINQENLVLKKQIDVLKQSDTAKIVVNDSPTTPQKENALSEKSDKLKEITPLTPEEIENIQLIQTKAENLKQQLETLKHQIKDAKDTSTYTAHQTVEVKVTLLDTSLFYSLIENKLRVHYQDTATKENITVYENFFLKINKNGTIQEIVDARYELNKNTHEFTDEDLRVLKQIKFTPAKNSNKEIDVEIPVGIKVNVQRELYTIKITKDKIRLFRTPMYVEYIDKNHKHYSAIITEFSKKSLEYGNYKLILLDTQISMNEYETKEFNPFHKTVSSMTDKSVIYFTYFEKN